MGSNNCEWGYGLFLDDGEDSPRTMAFRAVATVTATVMLWLSGPQAAFSRPAPKPKPYSMLAPGLTQTPDGKLRAKIEARQAEEQNKPRPDVRPLTDREKTMMTGRGPARNKYAAGTLPWQRNLRDINLSTGNLFKSFTDFQIAPARGAGLVLQRTYNSHDERVGPFGIGWTHAYDIRVEDAPDATPELDANGNQIVPRTDFFGGKHKYTRDADGLYTPPAYLFDEMDSKYDEFLVSGPSKVLEDEQRGMDGSVKHFIPEGTDASGKPSLVRVCDSIKDRNGNTTTLTYNAPITLPDGSTKKLLQKVTDPSGRELNFTWSNIGTVPQPAYRITQVVGPTGTYRVTYDYNAEKNLSAVHLDADGLNRTTTFGYTSYTTQSGTETGLLSSITDPLGHAMTYEYGPLLYHPVNTTTYDPVPDTLWVRRVTEPGQPNQTNSWYIYPTTAGSAAIAVLLAFNRSLPLGQADTITPDMRLVMDAYGRLTSINLAGNISGSFEQFFPGMNYTYDTSNNVTDTVQWQRTYDVSGSSYDKVTTKATYGPHGNVLTQWVDGFTGTTTTTYYNASKYFQKATVTDPMGNVTTIDYYDKFDASPGNRGQTKWVRDARYATTGKQFDYQYNQYGQKIWEKNLNNKVTTFEYNDTWGNLTKVIQDPDASGYTGLKRTTNLVSDVFGRVITNIDPNGKTSTFVYNSLGQPTTASFPTSLQGVAGETITYAYGANGRTASVTDGRGTTYINYEFTSDRVASVTDPVTGTLSYTYGAAGERLTLGLPSTGTITYRYRPYNGSQYWLLPKDDPNSLAPQLYQIEDDQGRLVDMNLDPYGAPLWIRYNQTFNGGGSLTRYVETAYQYDHDIPQIPRSSRGNPRLLQLTTTLYVPGGNPSSQVLNKNRYAYNNASQRTSNQITDNLGNVRTETYGYDSLFRLTSVNYGDGQTQGYTFDDMGNRLTKTDSAAGNDTLTYNAANMLLTRNGGSYTNDANGNTLTGGSRTSTWDAQNRLTQAVFNTKTSAMTYGSDNLRRKMLVTLSGGDQTETSYILDGQSVVQESIRQKPNGGSWTTPTLITYLQGPSGPMYRRPGSSPDVRWYLYDGLGSVLGEIDPNGTVTAGKKHDVYGVTRSTTGTPTSKHGWVGGSGHASDDETGLVYMRARHYDPVTGRFFSEDPAKDGNNWLVYVDNNPVNSLDSTGKFTEFQENVMFFALFRFLWGAMVYSGMELLSQPTANPLAFVKMFIAMCKSGYEEYMIGRSLDGYGACTTQGLSLMIAGAIGAATSLATFSLMLWHAVGVIINWDEATCETPIPRRV